MGEQSDPEPDAHSWQAIARELAHETDADRIAVLAHQLNEALASARKPLLHVERKTKPGDSGGLRGK